MPKFTSHSFVHTRAPATGLSLSPAHAVAGTLSLIRTVEGNFASGPFDLDLPLPAGYLFFPQSCGILLTFTDTVGTLGQVRFGTPSDRDAYLAPTFASITDAFQRQEWFIRSETLRSTAVTYLSAGLYTSGILTQAIGCFFFTGIMLKR
jgi:hypothetical protein